MKKVISIENISKQYRVGEVSTGTISHDLNRWWHKVRGKEDPYLKIGESNDRTQQGGSEYVWALRNVTFDVEQGDVLGIVGKNGAGKSTLLKILSKITGPTEGIIKTKGRMASLLEVGTGFHPEMTGRENIYMNGTLMGMSKKEVTSKLDEIVEFAGVAKYLDTPVKRYSSGMMVRLGFAVAAHMEPEILVVDEVLAVGDAEFQKKAIGKMKEVSGKNGRTVLYVSHNLNSLRKLCNKGILISNGECVFQGTIDEVIAKYISEADGKDLTHSYYDPSPNRTHYLSLTKAHCFLTDPLVPQEFFEVSEAIHTVLNIQINNPITEDVYGGAVVFDLFGNSIIESDTFDVNFDLDNLKSKGGELILTIPKRVLKVGDYVLFVHIGKWGDANFNSGISQKVLKFSIIDSGGRRMGSRNAITSAVVNWSYINE